MPVKLQLNLLGLQTKADDALDGAVRKFGQAVQAGFDDPVYSWPGVTKRRNGETAGTVRDVVDLGELQRSQEQRRISSGHQQLAWTADHAAATFVGAVFKRRRYTMPARNVPLNVLRDFDFEGAFQQAWK